MPSTINLYAGGQPKLLFPQCGATRGYTCPLPNQVAGEYDRGYFTLGRPFQPAAFPHQAAALEGITAANAAARLPALINLVVIPQKHVVTQLFVDIDPTAPVGVGCCVGAGDTMAGVTFDVVATMVDLADCLTLDDVEAVVEAGEDLGLPEGLTGLAADTPRIIHRFLPTDGAPAETVSEVPEDQSGQCGGLLLPNTTDASPTFVPAGRALVLGIRILTLPTTDGVTLADMAGRITLVAKTENFEYPWNV